MESKLSKEIITISNWVKSCETIEQLNNVENFLNKKIVKIELNDTEQFRFNIVNCMIMNKRKTKFKS